MGNELAVVFAKTLTDRRLLDFTAVVRRPRFVAIVPRRKEE